MNEETGEAELTKIAQTDCPIIVAKKGENGLYAVVKNPAFDKMGVRMVFK